MTKCDVAPATNIVDSKISYDIKEEDASATADKPKTDKPKEDKPKADKPKADKTKKAEKPKT